MEDLFKMYRRGLISWEDAYVKAYNRMVEASEEKSSEVVDYWASQVQSLAEEVANQHIKDLGYVETQEGFLRK